MTTPIQLRIFFVFFALSVKGFGQEVNTKLETEVRKLTFEIDSLQDLKSYDAANSLAIKVLELTEQSFGKNSEQYLNWMLKISAINYKNKKPDLAKRYVLEAVNITKTYSLTQSRVGIEAIYNAGLLYKYAKQFNESEPYLREAVNLEGLSFGKETNKYIQKLEILGYLLLDAGKFKDSEIILLEAKVLEEKVSGKNTTSYFTLLTKFGTVYTNTEQFDKAEKVTLEASDIASKVFDRNTIDYAMAIHNLGYFFQLIKQYEKAEPMYLEAQKVMTALSPKQDKQLGNCLNNLGNLYLEWKKPEKAELYYLESEKTWGLALGKESPEYARVMNNLGNLYNFQKKYNLAESYCLQGLSIREKIYGIHNTEYGRSLLNLATINEYQEKYDSAYIRFSIASEIFKTNLGDENSYYFTCLAQMASMSWKNNELKNAASLFEKISLIRRQIINRDALFMSEEELFNYQNMDMFVKVIPHRNTFALQNIEFSSLVIDDLLFDKGLLLNNNIFLRGLVRGSASPILNEIYGNWINAVEIYASESSKPKVLQNTIDSLQNIADHFEKELIQKITGFAEARRQIKWHDMRDSLKNGEAAIEFTYFQYYDQKSPATDSTIYTALIILPNDTIPKYIFLFEESQLQTLLNKTESRDESVTALYTRSGELTEKHPTYGAELYNLIWRPLDSLLQGVKTVYFSPSGLLNRVNLAALPVSKKKVLADRFQLHQMGSTRSLVVKTPEPVPVNYTAALYGGILYNSDSTAMAAAAQADKDFASGLVASTRSSLEYVTDVQRDTTRYWKYLPGTSAEITGLQSVLNSAGLRTHTCTAAAATEESLKALGRDTVKSPDILHIATHGFFFSDPEKRQHQAGDDNLFRWNQNPLFRSGLILAGADHAWQTGHPYEGREDGILTAYEISHLNLSNTKLAVLSACETGLGDIKGSEGVYGLQRAFKMAGVDYLMVSLWKVPDERTGEFMNRFYKYWLGGMPIHDAFTKAQRKMRKKYGVYEWGAWMLIE